ncbi:MAG: hypothetical protein M3220_15365, partial [Chloroflexota bacterium]|nr:hypothetical protein [Chloroflexota bacterium]
YDPGPPPAFAELFARHPDYTPYKEWFWYDWGPIFYRGKVDGSARVLCVASDPGPTERIAARTLVGDAGQRVQGFLHKIGLTRSYLCLNAFIYALHPARFWQARDALSDPAHTAWRNELFDLVSGPQLQAIVAFGFHARNAIALWKDDDELGVPFVRLPHPSSRDMERLLHDWRDAVEQLRAIVTPDDDGLIGPTYGNVFAEHDYARVPLADLPFGVPEWLGNDAWGRQDTPPHNNSVHRPTPDDGHTLIWIAPRS